MNIKEKDVCIVSYAKHMYNKSLGPIIDSHDTVIRINNGIHKLNVSDFGEKNSIASFTISTIKLGIVEDTYFKLFNQQKNFLQICKEYNFQNVMGFINELENEYWQNFLSLNKPIYNCVTKFNENYNFLNSMGLTCGLSTIIFTLKQKPKNLFICGFDFTMSMHPDYSTYYPIQERIGKTYDEIQKNWHSTKFEKYLLKKLFLKYKFKVDEELDNILQSVNIEELDDDVYDAVFKDKLKYKFGYKESFNKIIDYIN
jgi:hypothetical protein